MKRLLLTLCIAVLFLPQMGLYPKDDSTSGFCELKRGVTCYHTFTASMTTTTADSSYYSVAACVGGVSYGGDGDGTAQWSVMESRNGDGDSANIVTPDTDGDGIITSIDTSVTLDGYTVGKQGYRAIPVAKPFQAIDVVELPGSGTVYIQVSCL